MGYRRLVELVFTKAIFNLQSEASINYLSYAWWIIEPLLYMVVYYVVFDLLLQRGGEGYISFLLTGLIPWLWFSKTVVHAQNSLIHGKQLMNQLYIPKAFFPLTYVVQDTVKQLIVLFMLLSFLLLAGNQINLVWLWMIPIVLVQFLLIVSCALLAALVVPFVRDFSFVIPTTLQFMMFCSGIFYNYKSIPPEYLQYFFLNPVAVLLGLYRDILIDGDTTNIMSLCYVAIISVVLLIFSAFLYKRYEYLIPRAVLE